MTKSCPYSATLTEKASGVEVTNPLFIAWSEGFRLANEVEADLVKAIEAVLNDISETYRPGKIPIRSELLENLANALAEEKRRRGSIFALLMSKVFANWEREGKSIREGKGAIHIPPFRQGA